MDTVTTAMTNLVLNWFLGRQGRRALPAASPSWRIGRASKNQALTKG
jgi:hypothetical protein